MRGLLASCPNEDRTNKGDPPQARPQQRRTEMAMKGNQGISSKNVVHPSVRTGSGSRGTRPAGVSQIGTSFGNHVTPHGGSQTPYRGEKLHHDRSFQPVKFGNEVALNVGKGGCGTGRTIHGTGSQGQHGTADRGMPGLPSTRGQWPDSK